MDSFLAPTSPGVKLTGFQIFLIGLAIVLVLVLAYDKHAFKENYTHDVDYREYAPEQCGNGEQSCTLKNGATGRCVLYELCAPEFEPETEVPGGFARLGSAYA